MFDKTRLANVDIKVFVKAVLGGSGIFLIVVLKKYTQFFVTENNNIITIQAVKKVKKYVIIGV